MPPSDLLRRVRTHPIQRSADVRRVLGIFDSPEEILAARARMNPRPFDPAEARRYDQVSVENYWTDVQLDPDWVAAFRFTPQHGQPVISEVRIYPAERIAMGPGRWSGEFLGTFAPVPQGGLIARLVHKVRLGAARSAARAWISRLPRAPHLFGPGAEYAAFTDADARESIARRGPGRKGHGPVFFATLAAKYAGLLDAGNPRPVVTLAEQLKIPAPRIRDLIYRARAMKFLTSAPRQGQRGGQLTPKARAVLKVSGQGAAAGPAKRGRRDGAKPRQAPERRARR